LNPKDERLGITWPLVITELSARDAAHARISDEYEGFRL